MYENIQIHVDKQREMEEEWKGNDSSDEYSTDTWRNEYAYNKEFVSSST